MACGLFGMARQWLATRGAFVQVIEVAVEGKLSYESAVVQADRPVVVVYGQPRCGPCQMLDGSTREFAKKAKAYAVQSL